MGTWGAGPFDSDLAADFVDGLEGLPSGQIVDALQGALRRVVESGEWVDGGDGVEAVAAAALAASQISGTGYAIDPDDAPKSALPQLPPSLHTLAHQALQRVTEYGSELTHEWVNDSDAVAWRQEVPMIVDALRPGGINHAP